MAAARHTIKMLGTGDLNMELHLKLGAPLADPPPALGARTTCQSTHLQFHTAGYVCFRQ